MAPAFRKGNSLTSNFAVPRDVAAAQHTMGARGTAAGLVGLSGACVACGQRGVAFPSIFTFLRAPFWNVGHGSLVIF